jgi:hypothetical protein
MNRVLEMKRYQCAVRTALVALAIGSLVATAEGRDGLVAPNRPNRGMGDEWPARYVNDTPSTLAVAPLPLDSMGLPAIDPSGSAPSEQTTPDGSAGK